MATPQPVAPHLRIECIQTVMPAKAASPGRIRRISAPSHLVGKLLRGHSRIVTFYKRKEGEEEVDLNAFAGWLKESLNAALVEFPVLAGRVRRTEDGVEVKLTDSGLRLVQAEAELSVEEFMGNHGEEVLAYWGDVDEGDPQFSCLCYVQATRFKGDGYSISISCSLLLAAPDLLTTFFKRWSHLHATMKSLNRLSADPIFNYGKLHLRGRSSFLRSIPLDTVPHPSSHAFFFHHLTDHKVVPELFSIANSCIERATKTHGNDVKSKFCVVMHGPEEVVVEPWMMKMCDEGCNVVETGWEVMDTEGVKFEEGVEVVGVKFGVVVEGGVVIATVEEPSGSICIVVP